MVVEDGNPKAVDYQQLGHENDYDVCFSSHILILSASRFYHIIIEYLLLKCLPPGRKGGNFWKGYLNMRVNRVTFDSNC